MNHIINILTGLGSALGGFGESRPYSIPSRGDRARDVRNLAKDGRKVRNRLGKYTVKALEDKQDGTFTKRTGKTR